MNLNRFVFFAALAALASCQGCFGCKTSPIDDDTLLLTRNCETTPPLIEPPKLDILFVIDNSNSMREEQEAVARELTAFIDELKKGGGVPSDFNVGVITTSVYQNARIAGQTYYQPYPLQSGRLRPVPNYFEDGGFELETTNERLLVGTDPELIAKFARLVRQGVFGSGQEAPFEAVRLALLGEVAQVPIADGGNLGFLRDDARLLVVVLTDEDDCSEARRPPTVTVGDNPAIADCTENAAQLTTINEYHQLFTGLKNTDDTPKEIIWTAIAPVGVGTKAAMAVTDGNQVRNIDCPTSNQGGFRMRQMAEAFDTTLANLDSICRTSFRETLINIAQLASVPQTIEIRNVPDERLMQFVITRKDGAEEICTTSNNGIISFVPVDGSVNAKVQFGNQCRRRADDQSIIIKQLCAT